MSVVTAFEDIGPCQKKLFIEVPAPAVEAEWGRVIGNLRREVRIPGFRKGKVPESLLRQRFGDDIRQQVIDALLPRYWRQAQAEKSLDPLAPPGIEDLELERGKPMTFVASVEIRPEIEIGDLGGVDLPEGDSEPAAQDVEEALLKLRRQHSVWTEVDREAANGDLVVGKAAEMAAEVDVAEEGEGGGESKPEETSRPVHLEIGGEGVDEELSLALTGLKAGQSTEHTRKIDRDGTAREEHFRIEVEAVKEQELPDFDDSFAERFGLDNKEALEAAIKEQVGADKVSALRQSRERALLDQLTERYPLELPLGVVQQEGERMVRDNFERIAAQGGTVDPEKVPWEKLLEDVKPHAERRVHERLLLDAIGSHEDLHLDEGMFEQFLAHAAIEQKTTSMALRQQLSENGQMEALRADLLRQQTVQHLLGDDPKAEIESDSESTSDAEDPA
jgi:trigger factor